MKNYNQREVTTSVIESLMEMKNRLEEKDKKGQNMILEQKKAESIVKVCKGMVDAVKMDIMRDKLSFEEKKLDLDQRTLPMYQKKTSKTYEFNKKLN